MYSQYIDIMAKTKLFSEIEKEEIQKMLNCIKPQIKNYTKNNFIALPGEKFNYIGMVLEGEVSIIKENASGDSVIISVSRQGGFFGEMAAFSSKGELPAGVISNTASKIIFFEAKKLVGNCEKACLFHKKVIENILNIISEKALMLNKKLEYLSIKSMRGRISMLLVEQYKSSEKTIFMLPMNRNDMAEFLNVSRPSMSRELGRMKNEGLIDFQGKSIKILNIKRLKEIVGK